MSSRANDSEIPGEHVLGQLSAYIDNALGGEERAGVLAHIRACMDCRAAYIELRATQQMLRSLPEVAVPRAFTLTEEMVTRKEGFWQRLLAPRNAPRFATASVLAFVLVALVAVGDFSALRPAKSGPIMAYDRSIAPAAAQATTSLDVAQEAATSQSGDQAPQTTEARVAAALAATPTQVADAAAVAPATGGGSGAPPAAVQVPPSLAPAHAEATAPAPTQVAAKAAPVVITTQTALASSALRVPTAGGPYNGGVIASGNSSPTTTAIELYGQQPDTQDADSSAPEETGRAPFLGIEGGLLLLGLVLAVGAAVARRRGV